MNGPISAEQDEYLDMLVQFVCERSVIPVVGPGLLDVDDGTGGSQPLYERVAREVADALGVDRQRIEPPLSLNAVVCAYLERPQALRAKVYATVHSVIQRLHVEPPLALRQLAAIRDFDLFVSITPDTLLEEAIDKARFGGQANTSSLAYAPNRPEDLPARRSALSNPAVYHLLGRVSASPSYVVTEEDTLEYLSAMQSESKRPNLLFDDLGASNLLILGCRLSNWPARFFLRAAKGQRLLVQRDQVEAVVEADARQDRELVMFMGHFSPSTWLMPWPPAQFVAALHDRWQSRQRSAGRARTAPARASPTLDNGFAFISYSSQNLAAAERLRAALDSAGIDTWFDKEQLVGGDDWEAKIRDNIRRCGVFIPLLSRQLETRPEAFFRKEWAAAIERRRGMADNLRFLLPAVVDDLARDSPSVPEALRAVQWSPVPEGEPAPSFVDLVRDVVRECRLRQKGAA